MNSRFAEVCREKPLEHLESEDSIRSTSVNDGRSQRDRALTCEKDIFIGVFFDGTNNNKYRDTPGFSQSNVARLYEVFPGTPARQTEPTFLPKVVPGGTVSRPVFRDMAFRSPTVDSEDFQYYRKIYVPGLGTPLPDLGDTGIGNDRKLGLGGAFGGQARLEWATVQLVNQVHAAVFNVPIEPSIDLSARWKGPLERLARMTPLVLADFADPTYISRAAEMLDPVADVLEKIRFERILNAYENRLAAALKQRGANKPTMRKIRLSVFGFSRGAAAARAWVNRVAERWGSALAGVTLQVDFLGIFDTVASVGAANSFPFARRQFEWSAAGWIGHSSWASGNSLLVPASVKRCVHLVAALEVRGAFPLDSVCQHGRLPDNCKEVVYPGVHSDVGGGYPPDDQGRALGQGAAADAKKISQIPLAQMYREARMGGVPLAPESAMTDPKKTSFAIDEGLRKDFNAYVAATQQARVEPPPSGANAFARMWPTETQPRGETFAIMRRHYGFALRWRRDLLPSGAAKLPCLAQAQSVSRYQDIEDVRGAEAELAQEVAFLKNADPKKFGPLQYAANQRDKQREGDNWLQFEWADKDTPEAKEAARRLFERHVHDSRAWFKVTNEGDLPGYFAPEDEAWFVLGGLEKEREIRLAALEKRHPVDRDAIDRMRIEGPLIIGGREPLKAWGYIRHRAIYESGALSDRQWDSRQTLIESDEQKRHNEVTRKRLLAEEEQRHTEALQRIDQRYEDAVRRKADTGTSWEDLRAPSAQQRAREMANHDATVRHIESTFGAGAPSSQVAAVGAH